MKRIGKLAYIALFMVLCMVPLGAMALGVREPNYEKRAVESAPELFAQGRVNMEFPRTFETWFSGNFGLRAHFVTAYAALSYYLFHDSSNEKILAGKDGWLYFQETLDDYMASEPYTADEIARLSRILTLQRDYVQSHGSTFLFAIAPNKNAIYGEFMPERFQKADVPSVQAVYTMLEAKGIPHVNLHSVLTEAKSQGQLYHKKDSHWNNTGALLAYRAIMEELESQDAGLSADPYENATYTVQRNWSGDLEGMLLPVLGNLDEQHVYDIKKNYEPVKPIRSLEDISITTESTVNDKKLLMFRDSFANALIQYFSNAFGTADYTRAVPFDYLRLDQEKPNAVVVEIAERNLRDLLKTAPVMPAPGYEKPPDSSEDAAMGVWAETGKQSGLIRLSGYAMVPGTGYGETLVLLQGPKDLAYIPFPILEEDVAKQFPEVLPCHGWSMYLDTDNLPKGEYTVSVLVHADGTYHRKSDIITLTVD